ncbi:MAG: hypothetical protein ABJC13_00025 [Acidobacteriota bacterium]
MAIESVGLPDAGRDLGRHRSRRRDCGVLDRFQHDRALATGGQRVRHGRRRLRHALHRHGRGENGAQRPPFLTDLGALSGEDLAFYVFLAAFLLLAILLFLTMRRRLEEQRLFQS